MVEKVSPVAVYGQRASGCLHTLRNLEGRGVACWKRISYGHCASGRFAEAALSGWFHQYVTANARQQRSDGGTTEGFGNVSGIDEGSKKLDGNAGRSLTCAYSVTCPRDQENCELSKVAND